MNRSQADDLPVLTDVVEDTAPPPATDNPVEDTAAAPSLESALQVQIERLLAEKLQPRLAAAQQAVIAEVLAELKAELPRLIRAAHGRTPS